MPVTITISTPEARKLLATLTRADKFSDTRAALSDALDEAAPKAPWRNVTKEGYYAISGGRYSDLECGHRLDLRGKQNPEAQRRRCPHCLAEAP